MDFGHCHRHGAWHVDVRPATHRRIENQMIRPGMQSSRSGHPETWPAGFQSLVYQCSTRQDSEENGSDDERESSIIRFFRIARRCWSDNKHNFAASDVWSGLISDIVSGSPGL